MFFLGYNLVIVNRIQTLNDAVQIEKTAPYVNIRNPADIVGFSDVTLPLPKIELF